jgi:DNA-binding transcriptional ArsR family regulator
MTQPTEAISTDTALQILANGQRRRVLRTLVESGGTTTVDELARAPETDASSTAAGDATDDGHRIRLHHAHLPKLADADLVEYDPGDDTVRYRSSDIVEDLLRTCSSK